MTTSTNTAVGQVYRCAECGNMVEVLFAGDGTLVCCDQPMTLQVENTVDAAKEKHIPVIEKTANGYKVSVGSVAHPMEADHYIVWIELLANGKVYRQYLKPGEAPVAEFPLIAEQVCAREFCNKHGVWKAG